MQKKNKFNHWIVDALLFGGFLVLFFLDLTGLAAHQWLGTFIGLLAVYHMLKHWKWLDSVVKRFLGGTSWRARLYLLLDFTILVGFLVILITGLGMSTWFNLPLVNYASWRSVHVIGSILTLGTIVLKLLVHWRWIVATIKKMLHPMATSYDDARIRSSDRMVASKDRRDFLRLLLFVGSASAAAVVISTADRVGANLLTEGSTATATTQPTAFQPSITTSTQVTTQNATNTAFPTQAAVPTATAAPCTILCPRGCSYPGQCRRYIDLNGNGLCDNGECL